MLTLSLIFKLLVFHCVDATRLQANNRTTKLWSTLAPEDERKKTYTYKTNSDGILFRGIQIKSIVSWFQCACAWKKYDDGVCPVLLPVLWLTLQAMNCVAVNDAIFTTDNLKQILFRIMPMMMITMGVRRETIQTR